MKSITTHYAKTHLSRLLEEVRNGETIIILNGKVPVAKLTTLEPHDRSRPKLGTVTSQPVSYDSNAFDPMDADELGAWGL